MTAGSPVILAIDACTDACSVAVMRAGQVYDRAAVIPRGHAGELLAMVDALLPEAGIRRDAVDLVVYGRGPGAFTGVRISVGVAQGLAWALDVPVCGVSTLAALAQGAVRRHGAGRVLAALDARMGEVYWVACEPDAETGLMRAVDGEAVSAPEQVRAPAHWTGYFAVGTGWSAHGASLAEALGREADVVEPETLPRARDMLPFGRVAWGRGELLRPAEASPVYLRDRVTG